MAVNRTLPITGRGDSAFVWLIWGMTRERCDLIAIATTEERRDHYVEHGKARPDEYAYHHVEAERAIVDHLYGAGMLSALTAARLKKERR